MDGARPKRKSETRHGSGEYKEGHIVGFQFPYEEVETNPFVRHLSIRLSDILDKVGGSAEFRELRQNCTISPEIMMTICNQIEKLEISNFIFGSSSEGTTIPRLNSDTDQLNCFDFLPVVENISDASDVGSLLMIRDKHTEPGYVKLQRVYNGYPQTVYTQGIVRGENEFDVEGRICMRHMSDVGIAEFIDERNGPADTITDLNMDNVYSLRCSKTPDISSEWIYRKRPYRWPSKHMLDKMAKMGVFFVGVGHPASTERNIEWRMSFSLQERELMFSMNITQHKCYILLKIIKKYLIEPFLGKSICSYHLKTCMFYVIENTKAKLWKQNNLVQCVILCLYVLLKWVRVGYCPNYFIKEENMFDRDIHRTQRKNFVNHLKHLLSNGFGFLNQIHLDLISDVPKPVQENIQIICTYFNIKCRMIIDIVSCKVKLNLRLNDIRTAIKILAYLHTILKYLSTTKCIKDRTKKHTQEAFTYLKPYVHMQLAQSYASLAFIRDNDEAKYRHLQSCNYHLYQGRRCDMTSSRLLEVNILHKLEQYDQCIQILDQLEQEAKRTSLSMCQCDLRFQIECKTYHIKELYNLTVSSILKRTSTCMLFHRSDLTIIPDALQYEMYRSVNTPERSRDSLYERWMGLVAVDAVIYLHFMKYIAHAKKHQIINKHLAISKLESILRSAQPLSHRETGYNIMGWIHFQEGWIQQGIKYFRKSWSIRPNHNASKFHVMFYLFGDMNYLT